MPEDEQLRQSKARVWRSGDIIRLELDSNEMSLQDARVLITQLVEATGLPLAEGGRLRWTNDLKTRLKELYGTHSARQISEVLFGTPDKENAVRVQLSKLGVTRR